jgi:glyoxylase-like metal-dependent hydrolase (beta-lactamase superfamily II)
MNYNRRSFIKSSSFLIGALLYPRKNILGAINFYNFEGIKKIGPNIGVYTEKGGTIGWYVSDDAVVVVDSQFPDSAQNFVLELKKKTNRKIDILFNTHHHGDHTSGNYYLKDFVEEIVAQENCVKLQKKFYGQGEQKDNQVYAGKTFKDDWQLDLGKEKIKAYYFGSAHTSGDAVLHFQNANVVHMGDLVFNNTYPYMDRPAGCTASGSIMVLEKVASVFDKDTKFICGHADIDENVTFSINELRKMRDYFTALLEFVNKEIKAGKSLTEILKAASVPGFTNLTERWEGAKDMNLKAAYEELSSQK